MIGRCDSSPALADLGERAGEEVVDEHAPVEAAEQVLDVGASGQIRAWVFVRCQGRHEATARNSW